MFTWLTEIDFLIDPNLYDLTFILQNILKNVSLIPFDFREIDFYVIQWEPTLFSYKILWKKIFGN